MLASFLRGTGILLLTAATAWVLWAIWDESVPALRGPPIELHQYEWRWGLLKKRTHDRFAPAAVCAVGIVALLAATALSAARRRPRVASAAVLTGATALGWGFSLGMLHFEGPGPAAMLIRRTLDPVITSYHSVAVGPLARDPAEFVQKHADLLEGFVGAYMHAATHPPGPVLYYRAMAAACDASPALTARLAAVPDPESLKGNNPNGWSIPPDTPPRDVASALLGAALMLLLSAATCWPTALLARALGADRLAAARIGALSVLLPGLALMSPEFDQALALPVTACIALLAAAVQPRGGAVSTARRAACAGFFAALALFISYGSAMFLLMGGVAVAAAATARRGWPRRLALAAVVSVGVAFALFMLPAAIGGSPIQAAQRALQIHRQIYTERRDRGIWLWYGPQDVALFAGPAVALLLAGRALLGLPSLAAGRRSRPSAAADRFRLMLLVGLACGIASGTVRGEIGRLWIPIMPAMLVAALANPPRRRRLRGDADSPMHMDLSSPRLSAPGRESDNRGRLSAQPHVLTCTWLAVLLAVECGVIRLCWNVP